MSQNSFTTDAKLQEITDEMWVVDAAIDSMNRKSCSGEVEKQALMQLQVRYAYLTAMRDGIEDIRYKESAKRGFAARW